MRGDTKNRDGYLRRLRRVEGQVRGLQTTIDEDRYCIDVLTQISAVTRALQEVAIGLLDEHLGHRVREAIETGGRDRHPLELHHRPQHRVPRSRGRNDLPVRAHRGIAMLKMMGGSPDQAMNHHEHHTQMDH